jgi:hypothetical protein
MVRAGTGCVLDSMIVPFISGCSAVLARLLMIEFRDTNFGRMRGKHCFWNHVAHWHGLARRDEAGQEKHY